MISAIFIKVIVMLSITTFVRKIFFCSKIVMAASTSNSPSYFHTAAVATNTSICSQIGLDILKKGGSAADAAIAVLIGEGVCSPQSMGIGGGFLLTIYLHNQGTAEVLNSRECAPGSANKNMYGKDEVNDISSGGLAVAVPGELKGYWELHKKYGKVEWKELFLPAIKMCRTGIYITKYTANALIALESTILRSESLRKMFLNKKTGRLYKEGDHMIRPQLADTLMMVATQGPDALYNGPLTENFIRDIREEGGIISREDLLKYKPKWQQAVCTELPDNYRVYSVPPPGSGLILFTILDSISKLLTKDPVLLWHRMIEVWKFAFGLKASMRGPIIVSDNLQKYKYDRTYVNNVQKMIDDSRTYHETQHYCGSFQNVQDDGTLHISILAPNGDAVAVSTSINYGFGAAFVSPSTGIILNNQMMDFSIPHYYSMDINPENFIEPYKQPISSMCPTIIIDNRSNIVKLVIGGAGGPRIITATTQVITRNLWLKEDLKSAVAAPRLHHQLMPMRLEFEEQFSPYILKGLRHKGHELHLKHTFIETRSGVYMNILASVNAICVENDKIYAVGDPRRFAAGEGF